MVVHFFTRSSKDAGNWSFAKELKRLNSDVKFITGHVKTNYKRKTRLIFVIYPKWFYFGIKSSLKSLFDKDYPSIVVMESDIEILCLSFIQSFFRRPRVTKIFLGFIYTKNKSKIFSKLKKKYYSFILSLVDYVLIFSKHEKIILSDTFPQSKHKFIFVPYGIGTTREKIPYSQQSNDGYIFSAGRSQRDYKSLIETARNTCYDYKIVCDSVEALPSDKLPSNVSVLRDCFGEDYINVLLGAELVVIPLSAMDVSAGQMVLLHAMAYRKPIIITNTHTVNDYIHDTNCARLVPFKDPQALEESITELINSPKLREIYAEKAGEVFDMYHSTKAMARSIHNEIQDNAATL